MGGTADQSDDRPDRADDRSDDRPADGAAQPADHRPDRADDRSADGPAGRTVQVSPERLAGWLERFAAAHGPPVVSPSPDLVEVRAADGARAEIGVPFPPLAVRADEPYGGLVAHAVRPRTVGVVLVRRGGFGVGVFEGERVVASKVGSRHVQGRSAAGGWSQQRFARRREQQARQAFEAAADAAARVVVPMAARLDAVVTGGDRAAVAAVLADPRLAPLGRLVAGLFLDVPDPRQRVLHDVPRRFRAVRIAVTDPPP